MSGCPSVFGIETGTIRAGVAGGVVGVVSINTRADSVVTIGPALPF